MNKCCFWHSNISCVISSFFFQISLSVLFILIRKYKMSTFEEVTCIFLAVWLAALWRGQWKYFSLTTPRYSACTWLVFFKPIKIQYDPINQLNQLICLRSVIREDDGIAVNTFILHCVPKSGDDKTEKTMNMQNVEDFSINFAPYVMQAKDYYITLSLADVMKDLLCRHNVLKATKDKVLNYSWWTRTVHYSGGEKKDKTTLNHILAVGNGWTYNETK